MGIQRRAPRRATADLPAVPSVRRSRRAASGAPLRRGRPVVSATDALDVVALATRWPPREETVALLLDDELVGRTCLVVDGTSEPDDVLDVARLVVEVAEQEPAVHAAVLATVRLGPPGAVSSGHRRGDLDRWLELLEAFDEAAVELLDWFVVVEDHAESLRAVTGMPSLWPGG